MSYQWYKNSTTTISGATNSTFTIINVRTNDQAAYLVKVSNAGGITTSSNATLTVLGPPVITTQPLSQTVAVNGTASFSVAASGLTPISCQWYFSGSPVAGGTNIILTLTNVQTNNTGGYTVVLTNALGSATSAVASLTVLVPAGIATQPQSQAVVVGQSATFSVTASGTAPLRYRWRFNGTNVSGATNAALLLSNVQSNQAGGYTVVVTNSAGSVTSAVATLTVLVPAGITTQPLSQTVTQGVTAMFSVGPSGTAPFSYQWSFNGTALAGATNAWLTLTTVDPTDAGGYAVVVTNSAGWVTSAVATLTVLVPAGIATQPQSQTVTQGVTAMFSVVPSGTEPFRYQWRFNGTSLAKATNASLTLTNVQTTNAGSYTVVVTNSAGWVTSTVATLTVLVPAGITSQPLSQTVTQGVNATFSVVPRGTAPFSYQWRFNGTDLSDATNVALALSNVQSNRAGGYTVEVANSAGSATSAVATLTVLVPAGIATQPQSQAVVVGQSASFSVTANGTAPFRYQWRFNGAPLAGATNAALALSNVLSNQAGGYTVVVTNSAGWVTSAVATLTVYVPPAITTQPLSRTLVTNQSVIFSVVASGTAPFGYQWRFNGTDLIGTTNAVLPLINVETTDAGSYTVLVTNAWGSVTSAVATLTVLVPAGIATQPQSQSVVVGQSAAFSVVASGTAPFRYQWRFNGTPLPYATNAALPFSNIQSNQAGGYTVVVTNSAGSVTSAVATLTVYVPAGITAQPQSQAVVRNQSATFSVAASGTTPFGYQWRFNGTDLIAATNAALPLSNVQTNQAGNYTVMVTNAWGSVTSAVATLTVYVPAGIVTQPESQTLIQGQDASFSVVASGSSPFTYQWYFNGSSLGSGSGAQTATLAVGSVGTGDAGNYTVVVAGPGGSVTSAVAVLTVLVPAGIQTQPANKTVVQGQSATFSVVAKGTAPFSYQWHFNGTDLDGATNASLTITNAQARDAGNYFVVITNIAGSVDSKVVKLTVNIPPAITNQPESLTVTQAQTASLSVGALGTPTLAYQWYLNGVSLGSGARSPTLTINNTETNSAGNYTVAVNNSYGSATSVVATLTVLVPAQIATQPANQAVILNQNTAFFIEAFGDAPLSYQWSFNGTNISGATNTALALTNVQTNQAGNYTVLVVNNWGSVTSTVATLTVNVPPGIPTQPQSQTIVQNQSASFSAAASGTVPVSYQWRFNGANLSGATNAALALTNVQTTQAGDYTVVATNVAGSVTSAVATLTVLTPPAITIQPVSPTVGVGESASFWVVASGAAPLSYQWSFNGTPLSGATSSTLTLSNIQPTDAGSYTVVVTNFLGATTSSVATLTALSDWFRVVVNTNDSGAGSLRQAITDSQTVLGTKTIAFNITNAPINDCYTINALSSLPSLIDNTILDGYTQPGASENTLSNGNNAVIKICLFGTAAATDGLAIGNPGCAIYGLAIVNFPGNGIRLGSSGGAAIQGNFIGLNPDGVTTRGNTGPGLRSTAAASTIGGPVPWQRNVISGNLGGGIQLQNSSSNVIQGNFIGTDASGTLARGNTGIAVELRNANSYGNLVGGSNPGEGNVITGAMGTATNAHGIVLMGNAGTTIQGNLIGTDVTGTNVLGNAGCGIYLFSSAYNQLIGGTSAGAGNVIAYNGAAGVWAVDGINNTVLGNSIFANGGLGIDLGALGAQPNDAGDADTGANNLQNYPVLSGATNWGGTMQINGTLDSTPNQSYRLEFFSNPNSTSTNRGEGKHFLGSTNILIGTATTANFTVNFPYVPSGDRVVTATATDPAGNSSELSPWILIANRDLTLTSLPQSQTVVAGQTVSFSVSVTGTGPFGYQWSHNNVPLAGATSSILTLTNVQTTDAGSYTVFVANSSGSLTSAVATLTVYVPVGITTQPQNSTVATGTSASFSVAASGTAPLSYQWQFNGADLAGATSSTLVLNNVQTTDAGSYTVVVANPWGSITSAAATLMASATVQITAAQDTYVRSAATNLNYGASTSLVVDKGGGGIGNQRALVQFDLSSIPAGATITNATLQMQATANGGAFNINIYRVTEAWVEGSGNGTAGAANWNQRVPGTNWSSAGGAYDTTAVATLNTGSIGQHNWNLTTLVQGWHVGATINNGIIIGSPDTGTTNITYASREGATPPRLVISYVMSGNTPPAITQQPVSLQSSAGSNATFSVTATGSAPLRYQWSFNGTVLSGATNATLALANVQTNDAGSYALVITNFAGSVTSAVATLTVTNSGATQWLPMSPAMTATGLTWQISVPVGSTYVIWASTNFLAWTPIATNVALTGSPVFSDPAATNYNRRFYRAMER